MSRPLNQPANSPRKRRGILSIFTPLNTVMIVLLLAGVTTATIIQFTPPTPVKVPTRIGVAPPPELLAGVPRSADVVFEGIAKGSALPLFAEEPATLGLAPPLPTTRVPVNAMDLFTSKPVGYGAPMKTYKGYNIGFCCAQSAGYNGGWDGMSEAEQDTYVRHFLK